MESNQAPAIAKSCYDGDGGSEGEDMRTCVGENVIKNDKDAEIAILQLIVMLIPVSERGET